MKKKRKVRGPAKSAEPVQLTRYVEGGG
jgi:hypothetical protein